MHWRDWGREDNHSLAAAINDQTGQVTLPTLAGPSQPPATPTSVQGQFYGKTGVAGYAGSGVTVVSAGPKCKAGNSYHSGEVVILKYENGATLRGAERGGAMFLRPDLVLDFADLQTPPKPFVKSGAEEFKALNEHMRSTKIISFDWPDGAAPVFVQFEFWKRLSDLFPPNAKVVACCAGGHGRTGTGLAALMIAAGFTAEAAIDYIRDNYCPKAVETKGQEMYLYRLERERDGETD